jgi:heptose I phosphotransferase
MNPSPSALALLAATCLVLVLLLGFRRRSPRRAGFLEISPRYRSFFREHGLTEPAHFLAAAGETPHIVSGHPDRNVARIEFEAGSRRWTAYLKREHHVTWRTRLGNALAGFGFRSRSLREARMLQILQREGIPGPEWLAAGEDEQGRAFLLVRAVEGVELRAVLRAERDPKRRRRIARNLAATLARLHAAGFHHPDLYANHLFVDPRDDSIHLLDWQRPRLMYLLSGRQRRRNLAALHATTDDSLVSPRERLVFLRAYLRANEELGLSWPEMARGIEAQARHLLRRRHIREKRQPPAQPQAWICLDGEALCVTPVFQQRCGEQVPDWLRPSDSFRSEERDLIRRWPTLPGVERALLVRRREAPSLPERWRIPSRRASSSPAQRQAALLLRLQRHGIPAPQVLALGRTRDASGRDAFMLLTEPLTNTCSLEAWLACQTRRRNVSRAGRVRHWSVLRQVGTLLHRLHEASCYLEVGPAGCGLAVRIEGVEATVVLDRPETVTPRRQRRPVRAARDVRFLRQLLHRAGCGRTDLCRFQAGYGLAKTAGSMARNLAASRPSPRERIETPPAAEDSLWHRLVRGARRTRQRHDWPRFAGPDWAETILDVAVTDRFNAKQGRSTGRWILRALDGEEAPSRLTVYLKRHYVLPWWQGMMATLWPVRGWSPALREWDHLEWARRRGLPVPHAVAAGEYLGPWGQLRSFLAVEELAGMVPLSEAIPLAALRQDAAAFRRWKHALVAEMARLTRLLHDRRCFHKDLYLCHFFIAREDTRDVPAEGWRGRAHLIDLHRLAYHPRSWRVWQTKDLAQLLYSSEMVGVDARDRLAFWRAYHGVAASQPRAPWLRRFVLFKWRRYRHHNMRNQRKRENERAAA